MSSYFCLILHAHLPFVRHPEHGRFLEESWLYEAITETYLPLIELLEKWRDDGLDARLTLSLSPTLCAMLLDPLLRSRYERRLAGLVELAEKETYRTHWDRAFRTLAESYHLRYLRLTELWRRHEGNLVRAFRELQEVGVLEIATCAATHALLPLLADHPPSLRAQIDTARDSHRSCFGQDPVGIWLPECAYAPELEPVLQAAGLRWFVTDTHGLLKGTPRPKYGVFAPVFTPNGLAVFGRDHESARQVWSRREGYPGNPRFRDFYRDIGFDLDLDYVEPYLPSPGRHGFTGIKYYRITGPGPEKRPYDEELARETARAQAKAFLVSRLNGLRRLCDLMDRPPVVVAPYDAELFGHWWHEGFEFLDHFVRSSLATAPDLSFVTPTDYLRRHATNQVIRPSVSSWGDEGYWGVWLNERNDWILPHLRAVQTRMTELTNRFSQPDELHARALRQAAREVMLAQASDWPFILHTGTTPEYAERRVRDHLLRFLTLYDQITSGTLDPAWLAEVEARDNLFPQIETAYWRSHSS